MRTGSIISIVTGTFVAIGVALSVGLTGNGPNIPDDFEKIYYTSNVEHGRLAMFGDCPLGREIVVGRTGKISISWYVQQPDIHGCVRATVSNPGESIEGRIEEAVIARTATTLSKSVLRELLERLEALRWEAEWREPKDIDMSYSTGCKRTTDALPGRNLAVVRSEPEIAILSVFGENARGFGSDQCVTNEIANAETLDSAVAPFAPLLPAEYHLPAAIAEQLNRER